MIALVTCDKHPELTEDDRLLVPAFAARGLRARAALWDDPDEDWAAFEAVILRSPWDYHTRVRQFTGWLERLGRDGARVWNPLAAVSWNFDKRYLVEMEKRGIPCVPSELVERARPRSLASVLRRRSWSDAVVKPTVSASGRDTWRVKLEDASSRESELSRLLGESDVLVQPFVPEILSRGELSFLFFGREFSHAVLKKARAGEFRIQTEHGGSTEPTPVPESWIAQARRALDAVREPLLYARVDLIPVQGDRQLWLGELELIEPHCYLEYDAEAPRRFVDAYLRLRAR